MTTITTEQKVSYSVKVVDGRGRPAPIDGEPIVASSDETIVTVTPPVSDGAGGWTFDAVSVLAGNARITFSADAEIGPDVNSVVGEDDIEVTLDPRTGARMVELTAGTPVDD